MEVNHKKKNVQGEFWVSPWQCKILSTRVDPSNSQSQENWCIYLSVQEVLEKCLLGNRLNAIPSSEKVNCLFKSSLYFAELLMFEANS